MTPFQERKGVFYFHRKDRVTFMCESKAEKGLFCEQQQKDRRSKRNERTGKDL